MRRGESPETRCRRTGNGELAHRAGQGYLDLMKVEIEIEDDGRWIAEVPTFPGAMAYGSSRAEAVCKVEALVLRVLADRVEFPPLL